MGASGSLCFFWSLRLRNLDLDVILQNRTWYMGPQLGLGERIGLTFTVPKCDCILLTLFLCLEWASHFFW